MATKRALILGVGGMDGSYLAELLLSKGYEVHGLYRRSSVDNLLRVRNLIPWEANRLTYHLGDITDYSSLERIILEVVPDEIYNMADQDDVRASFDAPCYSHQVTYGGVVNLLEVVKSYHWGSTKGYSFKVFQPVSATMFGGGEGLHEQCDLIPDSPYACAKAAAFLLCRHYRRKYGMHVSCGIMFNHDSPRRGPSYLLQKIARQAVEMTQGKRERVELYNLDHEVDIGHAREYVDAAWRMLQQDQPDDYVVATGRPWSVRDLAQTAQCEAAGPLKLVPMEKQIDGPSEPRLIGDPSKAKRVLGWEAKMDAGAVVREIVKSLMLSQTPRDDKGRWPEGSLKCV